MSLRRSLRLPILLAIAMVALLVVLTIGWVLLSVFGALANTQFAGLNWALFGVGTAFIGLLLVGVVIYMVLSIKAINLNRRQSNFIDSVTHELKSPIASMKLYLQTLHRRQVGPEQQASFVGFMLEDVERLDHLINQMLDAGRLESDRVDGEAQSVDLADVLRECAGVIAMRYRVPAGTIALDLTPCAVRARRIDVEMLFRNLMDNAVKYAGAPPQVRVGLGPESGRWAVARVEDNGRGVPLKHRRKIFGRFVRLGSELEREKPGTGLGLYIAQTIVRRLKGSIRVRDRRPGPGTVFEVQLPLEPAPPPGPPPAEAPPPEKAEVH